MNKRKRSTDENTPTRYQNPIIRMQRWVVPPGPSGARVPPEVICLEDSDGLVETAGREAEPRTGHPKRPKTGELYVQSNVTDKKSRNESPSSKSKRIKTSSSRFNIGMEIDVDTEVTQPLSSLEYDGLSNATGNTFKMPEIPRQKRAIAGPSRPMEIETASNSQLEEQEKKTSTAKQFRKAITDLIEDYLETIPNESSDTQILELVNNLWSCLNDGNGMYYIFSPKQYPSQTNLDDLSSSLDIEEFACCWLFGLTGMLFGSRFEDVPKVTKEITSLIQVLCQYISNGYPLVCDRITPQLLKVFKDLSRLYDETSDRQLNINLFSHSKSSGQKPGLPPIIIKPQNEYAIPYFVEATSPLFPRIFFFHVKLRHVLVELLHNIFRTATPDCIKTLFTVFSCCSAMPSRTFLTNCTTVRLIQTVIESPSSPNMDLDQLRGLFGRYSFLGDGTYTYLTNSSGLLLLQIGLRDYMYSSQFLQICEIDKSDVISNAYRVLQNNATSCNDQFEILKFTKLVSLIGLDVVVHPLLPKTIVCEIEDALNQSDPTSIQRNFVSDKDKRIQVSQVSKVWKTIRQCWVEALHNNRADTNSMRREDLVIIRIGANLMKLVCNIQKYLDSNDLATTKRFKYFDRDEFLRWTDFVCSQLENASKLSPIQNRELFANILETLIYRDEILCSNNVDLLTSHLFKLLTIPIWPLLHLVNMNLVPNANRKLSKFATTDSSEIQRSSLCMAKALRTLRLSIFRPWCFFVEDIVMKAMENNAILDDMFQVTELLDAVASVSWVVKRIPLKTTIKFLYTVVEKDLWKIHSNVRTSLGKAITAIPCICWHQLRDKGKASLNPLPELSGCLMCFGKIGQLEGTQLLEILAQNIACLAAPLLKSKFLMVKLDLVDVITRFNNHRIDVSPVMVLPFLEVAVRGKANLSDKIFQKIGQLLSETGDVNQTCEGKLDAAQRILKPIPIMVAELTPSKERWLMRMIKICNGYLLLCQYPVGINVFIELVKKMLVSLAQSNNNVLVAVLCQQAVDNYKEHCHCKPFELISRIRHDIAEEIIKIALKTFYKRNQTDADVNVRKCSDFLSGIRSFGHFRSVGQFTHYFYPVLLQQIVPKLHVHPRYEFLLSALAITAGESVQTLLQSSVMHYFPTLLLDHSNDNVSKFLQFSQTSYSFDVLFVAKQTEQVIINETLCRLHAQINKVIRCLPHLCKWEDASNQILYNSGSIQVSNRLELQELLSKRLLGFFLHLDTKLHSRVESVQTKKNIMSSFTALITLMGKNKITPLRSKVYKTLYSMTAEGPEYFSVLYEAWKAFAANLDNAQFGPMTSQILAALLPLRDGDATVRAQVDGLISHFVNFKHELTEAHYHELYFLLDNCDDQGVLKTIGNSVKTMKDKNWFEYFTVLVKGSSHENSQVQYLALQKLNDVLQNESSLVHQIVLAKGQQHVSQVISTLLSGLCGHGHSDEKLRLVIVDCLGALGALDPVRFREGDDHIGFGKRSGLVFSGVTTFCVLYLQELIQEFKAAKDTTTFDYCACLIQQVLQGFNVGQPDDPIWGKLSDESKELIEPLLTAKYSLETSNPIPELACPIYLSAHGRTFDLWLLNWLTVLISCITNKEPKIFSLFNKSKHLLRRNPRIAAFIIPHVAVWAAFCGTVDQRRGIVTEMNTVLERWTHLEKMKLKAKDTMPVRDSETETGFCATEEDLSIENERVFHSRCTQVVFSVLDYFHRSYKFFKRKWGLSKANEKSSSTSSTASTQQTLAAAMTEENMGNIEEILNYISSNLVSQVAFDCQSYTVALYHLEEELRKSKKLQQNLGYLQRIYVSLNDMDSVIGIATIRENEPALCEVVLENLAQGQTVASVQNLERMTESDPTNLIVHSALAQAYFNLEEPSKAAVLLRATIDRRSEWELALQDSQLESLVRLKQWPELKTSVAKLEQPTAASGMEEICFSWNIAMSRTISKIESNELDDAVQVVEKLKAKLVAPLVAASEELNPYKRAYFHVVQLHILTEIVDAIKLFRKHSMQSTINVSRNVGGDLMQDIMDMITKWERRLSNVSKARKVIDQILNVRRSLFEIMKKTFHGDSDVGAVLSAAISDCWLEIAKDASKCGNFIRADNSLLQAKQFMSSKVVIEEAKILSRKGDKETAILVLQKGIARYFPQKQDWIKQRAISDVRGIAAKHSTPDGTKASKILCSKALLLLAKLCEEQKLLDVEGYIAKYKEPSDVYRDSEKNFFTLGSYHDRLWSHSERENPAMQATVVRYYSQSLFYGCKYVHQSLPRLLSIWFDFAAGFETGENYKQHHQYVAACQGNTTTSSGSSAYSSNTKSVVDGTFENMNESIKRMNQNIPKYILMTAFSQLISRICHWHKPTWEILKDIIVSIIVKHPHQALWMSIAVSKSVNKTRANKCLEIYKNVERLNPNLKTMIKHYTTLSSKLIDLSDKTIDRNTNKASLNSVCKALPKLVNDPSKLQVSVPFQVFLHPTLPHGKFDHINHHAFPESTVMINGIEDTIEVMSSLVRPKKITFVGDNGKFYGLMCKPKDDLRKDSKVMEVNNVVNWYLKQNTESSQRQLRVRTFSVVPLNEECGLLEWVPNLHGLRPIILSLFKEKGISINHREIRTLIQLSDSLETQQNKFLGKLIRPHPPVFREWFFNNFNNHQAWYAARMSYIRTAAVMSIVGYIMGLGDRHGENIMIDATTGELVHVDFNCLFNKGETFEWIERVPFRLTQNLVDAMGPLGYEGIFRRSCEITMNMFREHQSIFLSVLRPFVFDPLVEWDKVDRKGKGTVALVANGETTSSQAVETMKHILNRLNGTARNLKKNINSELSVKAQVDHLIEEATSVPNLCRMYIGWAAYL